MADKEFLQNLSQNAGDVYLDIMWMMRDHFQNKRNQEQLARWQGLGRVEQWFGSPKWRESKNEPEKSKEVSSGDSGNQEETTAGS